MKILCCMVGISMAYSATALAAPAADEQIPAELSLTQAEQLFLERGLDLLIAQYGAEGAEGDARAASAHPNPGLDIGILYTPQAHRDVLYSDVGGQVPRAVWGFSVGVTDNAAISDALTGKHSLRVQAASKALAAARLNVADVKRLELGQLRQAYTAAVMARLNLVAAKESFDTFDKQLALNQTRYDEGAISGLDLSRARQAQLEALQTVDQADSGLKQSIASLLFLLGARTSGTAVRLTSGIDYSVPAQLKAVTLGRLQSLALDSRTDVKIAAANLDQAEVQVRQAKRSRVPDISVSLGYSEQCNSDTCSSAPAYSAGLQGNLPLIYQQQGEIKRARANEAVAERTLAKVKAQVFSEVTQAYAGFVASKSQVERMESKLLEQAKISRDLAQQMYQKGAASFIDFMDAQRQYVASRLEYNQDLAAYWNAVYELEQVTGSGLR